MWIALLGSLLAIGVAIACLLGALRLISRTLWLRKNGTHITYYIPAVSGKV